MRKVTSVLFVLFCVSLSTFGCAEYLRGLQAGTQPGSLNGSTTQPTTQQSKAFIAGENTTQAVTTVGSIAGTVAANTPLGTPVNTAAGLTAAISGVLLLGLKYVPPIINKMMGNMTTTQKINVIHDVIANMQQNASVPDASKSGTNPPTTPNA